MHSKRLVAILIGVVLLTVFLAPQAAVQARQGGSLRYGDTVDASLNNARGDRWTFEGNAGDVAIIEMRSEEIDPFLELRTANDILLINNDDNGGDLSARIVFQLSETAVYTIIAKDTFNSLGAYTLSLNREIGSIQPPDEPSIERRELTYGASLEATLQNTTGDRWTFVGATGDVVSISMSSDELDSFIELYSPSGELVARDDDSGGNFDATISNFALPEDGIYTVVARDLGSATLGTYRLALSSVQASTPGTISYGQSLSATLSNPEGDRWTFDAAAGDLITINLESTDFDTYLELLDDAETVLTADDDSGTDLNSLIRLYSIPEAGTYTVVVRAWSDSDTGNYTLELRKEEEGESLSRTLNYGDSIENELSSVEGDVWTFSGAESDVINLAVDSFDFDPFIELYGPDGELLTSDDDSGSGLNSRIDSFRLPVDGTYRVVIVDFSEEGQGTYTVTLEEAELVIRGQITYNTPITDSMSGPSGDRWTFEGQAGDTITIAVTSTDFDSVVNLLDPEGILLISDDDSGGNLNALIDFYTLPETGTYTILVYDLDREGRGEYRLSVETQQISQPGTLEYGDSVGAELSDSSGDRWTFVGQEGDAVTIAVSSSAFDSYLELQDPDGRVLAEDDDSGGSLNAQIAAFVLPSNGVYTIVVSAFSGSTEGAYRLSLTEEEIVIGGTLGFGDTVEGTLSSSSGDRWTFEGSAGTRVTIAVESDVFDAQLELYGPSGDLLTSDDDSGGNLNPEINGFSLPESGVYTIVVLEYNRTETGPYTLSLQSAEASQKGNLSYGDAVTEELSGTQGDAWTFSGAAGDRITIEVESSFIDSYVELYGPEGELLTSDDDSGGGLNSLIEGYTLEADGTYTILITDLAGERSGNYTLRLTAP